MIDHWFLSKMVERLKASDTPYQTDLDYKRALGEQLLKAKKEQKILKK